MKTKRSPYIYVFPKYKKTGIMKLTKFKMNKVTDFLMNCVDCVRSPVRLCKRKCKIMDDTNKAKL